MHPRYYRGAGPYEDHEIYTWYRYAIEWQSHGCDYGPPSLGFWLLDPEPLRPAAEYCVFEEAWFPPSVTKYTWQRDGKVAISCTCTISANPTVRWFDEPREEVAPWIFPRHLPGEPGTYRYGELKKSFGDAERGSIVVTRSTHPGETFLLVEFPPSSE